MNPAVEKRNLADEIRSAFTHRGFDSQSTRLQALDLLMKKGLPGPKSEEYKFTPVTRFLEKSLDLTPGAAQSTSTPQLPTALLNDLKCNIIVFHNGRFSETHSKLIDTGIVVRKSEPSGGSAVDPFDLLNLAFHDSFVEITVQAGNKVEHPLVIVYSFNWPSFAFANPRWRCTIGEGSSLTLIECSSGKEETTWFNNKQSVVTAAASSELEYIIVQGEDNDLQLANTRVELASAARASCFTFTFAGQLVRNNFTLTIDGEGVDAHLYGLYLLTNKTLADNHTVVDHMKPNSHSNELYKGVMDENSKGVFNGKIYVRPNAQKTEAYQSNRNILLSESATINTKPQLEIWADDVKCSHGCTTGQLDEDALFYLRSRGIPKDIAKGMMLYAFAAETVSAMKNETVRNFVDGLVAKKLHKDF